MLLRQIDVSGKSQGFLKESLAGLEVRVREVQARIDAASEATRCRTERGFARSLLQEVHTKLSDCDKRMAEAMEAEPPLTLDDSSAAAVAEAGRQALRFERLVQ